MRTTSIAFVAVLALAACGGKKPADTTPAPGTDTVGTEMKAPLYDRLGKTEGITKVVEIFVTNVGKNNEINARFQNSDLKVLKEKLVLQICEATGGPCKYKGVHKDMKTTHTGMKITEQEFTSMVNDLVAALNEVGVPKPEQDELLGALGAMKPDIVGI